MAFIELDRRAWAEIVRSQPNAIEPGILLWLLSLDNNLFAAFGIDQIFILDAVHVAKISRRNERIANSMRSQLGGSIEYDWNEGGLIVTLRMDRARLTS